MSNRSVELLLRMAGELKNDPCTKMGARRTLDMSASLASEIETWARGYLVTLAHKMKEKAAGKVIKEVTVSFNNTYEPSCYRDVDYVWVEGKSLCLSSTRHGVQWEVDLVNVHLIDDGNRFYTPADFVAAFGTMKEEEVE